MTTAEIYSSIQEVQPVTPPKRSPDFFLLHFVERILSQADKQKNRLSYFSRKIRGLESRVNVWNSKALLDRFTHTEYESPEAIKSALWMDWQTLLHETFFWKTPTYELFTTGVDHSYQEELPKIGQGFVENQQQKGGELSRAEVENNNMQRLTHWINDPRSVNSVLIWVSPRGKKTEGYPGTDRKNPVMINYYYKDLEGGVIYQQFKVWSDNTELTTLQQLLFDQYQGKLYPGTLSDEIQLAPELHIIDHLIELSTDFSTEMLEALLYQHETKWPVNRSQFPDLNIEEFNQLSQQIFEHYFQAVLPIFTNQDEKKLQQQLKHLDVLFSSAFQTMLKYGEQFLPTNEKKKTSQKQIEKLTLNQIFNRYQEKTALQLQILVGQKLTPAQIGKLKELNTFFMVSNRMFSLAQCGIFSPVSLALKVNNLAGLKIELNALSLTNKQELLKQLDQAEYIELDLTAAGASQIWMVPTSYLEAPGCRVGTGEVKNGIIMEKGKVYGPCVTPEYPFGIPLDDPLEQLAMPLTKQQYDELLSTLQQETQQAQFDEIEQHLQEQVTDEDPNNYFIWLTFHQIQEKILKPTLSFQELLNSDLVSQEARFWLQEKDYELLTSLTNSREILEVLEKIWVKQYREQKHHSNLKNNLEEG